MAVETSYIFREALLTFVFFLQLIIIVRAILSWMPYNKNISVITDIVNRISDPLMNFAYKLTNNRFITERFDFTPFFVYFILSIIRMLLNRTI